LGKAKEWTTTPSNPDLASLRLQREPSLAHGERREGSIARRKPLSLAEALEVWKKKEEEEQEGQEGQEGHSQEKEKARREERATLRHCPWQGGRREPPSKGGKNSR